MATTNMRVQIRSTDPGGRPKPMRILFATACTEDGKDGVGDYTRLLATEVAKQGHEPAILALNDRFVGSKPVIGRTGECEYLRLPKGISRRARGQLIAEFKRRVVPDWVSVQFVPYGFNPKGIVAGWGGVFGELASDARVHVMMHELWIGQNVSSPIQQYLMGLVQRRFVIGLLRRLRPCVVTSTCGPYLHLLEAARVRVSKLPLFGNIPCRERVDCDILYRALSEAGQSLSPDSRGRYLIVAMFGGDYPGWLTGHLVDFLQSLRDKSGKEVVVLSVGRSAGSGSAAEAGLGWSVVRLGERDTNFVSAFLQWSDLGLATVPAALVEKSGSVAAMVEHGLPVIVTRDDWRLRSCPHATEWTGPDIFSLNAASSALRASGLPKGMVKSRREMVTSRFLNMLHLSN